jgi:trehalose 6-phosphate phosphatase
VPLRHVIGNHGLERWSNSTPAAPIISEAVRCLRKRLDGYSGVHIEDKKYTITVHYRQAMDKDVVRRAIARAVRVLPHLRAIAGKQAVNLIPCDGADKGAALQEVRRALACDRVIYVGDDGTDEPAFTSGARMQLLSIRVGASRRSCANYCLRRQADIDRFLAGLIELRRRTPDNGARAASKRAR